MKGSDKVKHASTICQTLWETTKTNISGLKGDKLNKLQMYHSCHEKMTNFMEGTARGEIKNDL